MTAMLDQPQYKFPSARLPEDQLEMGFPRLATAFSPVGVVHVRDLLPYWKLIAACAVLGGVLAGAFAYVAMNAYVATAVVLVGGNPNQTESIVARGDFETYSVELRQLAAKTARIDAELADAENISFPPDLIELQGDPAVAAMMEGERRTLAANRQTLNEKLNGLRLQHELLEQRATTLVEQVRLAKVQTQAIDEEAAGVRVLVEKQLAPTSRLLDLSRTEAIITNNQLALESDLLRTRQTMEQLQQQRVDAVNQREAELLEERQEILRRIGEAATRRGTAANVLANQTFNQRFDPGMMANEIDVITSDALIAGVVRELGLDKDEAFMSRVGDLPADASEQERLAAATEALQESLEVSRVEPGSRLDINYRSVDPEEAMRVANAVATTYVGGGQALNSRDLGENAKIGRGNHIVRIAKIPEEFAGPGKPIVIAAGALLGLLLGVALVVLSGAAASRYVLVR